MSILSIPLMLSRLEKVTTKIIVFKNLYSLFFFEAEFLSCRPSWSAMAGSQLTATAASRVQVILLPQPPKLVGITGACHHVRLIFVFLVEMGFHHIGQDGLDRTPDLR